VALLDRTASGLPRAHLTRCSHLVLACTWAFNMTGSSLELRSYLNIRHSAAIIRWQLRADFVAEVGDFLSRKSLGLWPLPAEGQMLKSAKRAEADLIRSLSPFAII
jgi:hypothetical protein